MLHCLMSKGESSYNPILVYDEVVPVYHFYSSHLLLLLLRPPFGSPTTCCCC